MGHLCWHEMRLPGTAAHSQSSSPAGLWTNQLESLPAEIGLMTNLQAYYPPLSQ